MIKKTLVVTVHIDVSLRSQRSINELKRLYAEQFDDGAQVSFQIVELDEEAQLRELRERVRAEILQEMQGGTPQPAPESTSSMPAKYDRARNIR